MDLTINFWIRDPENGQGNVKSDVNLAVLDVLDREGHRDPVPAARRPCRGRRTSRARRRRPVASNAAARSRLSCPPRLAAAGGERGYSSGR